MSLQTLHHGARSRAQSERRPPRASGARLALCAALALAPLASAQSDLDPPPAPALDAPAPAAQTARADGDMTPTERLRLAQEIVTTIQQSSQAVLQKLQTARADRDVVRVLCLNDKLNQVDVALRSAEDRMVSLRAAVEQADGERVRHEYTVLDVLSERVRALVSESNQCVGEETGFIGEAEVSFSVDPNLPDDSVTDDSTPPPLAPPPPTVNSPIE